MTCPYCSSDFSVYSFHTNPSEWSGNEENDLGLYVCDSCGGEVTASKKSTTATCPYCESKLTLTGRLSGKKRPDYILPFEIDLNKAAQLFKKHLGDKELLPDAFKNESHLLKCRRMYLPFFMFSSTVKTEYSLWQQVGDDAVLVNGQGQFVFDHMPVDACKRIPNSITEALEPFDFSKAMPFSPSYLTDCNAEVYDESTDACIKIAAKRMIQGIYDKLKLEYSRDCVSVKINKIDYATLDNTDVKYLFMPVWILSTRWKKKNYIFALNGQTGKIVSQLPCDNAKACKKFLKRFLLVFGIGILASLILWWILL